MPIRRRQRTVQPLAAINLTSLLDVTFMLLLAFMIVAPALKSGLNMELPQIAEPDTLSQQKSFTISIKKPEEADLPVRVYFEGKRVDLDELREELATRRASHGSKMDILIEADRTVACQDLFKVFSITQKAGISNIGIPVEPEK